MQLLQTSSETPTMGRIITWSTPQYSPSVEAHETDSLFYAEDVFRYRKFESPLSIKFCQREALRYIIGSRKVVVPPGSFLLVNAGTEMECLPNEAGVQALMVFFTGSLMQDVYCNLKLDDKALLDGPPHGRFFEHLYPPAAPFSKHLGALARQMAQVGASNHELSPGLFFGLAEQLLWHQQGISRQIGRLKARNAATREELFRRVLIAREYMEGHWRSRVTLQQAARVACLSPYHFHRTFREAFGQPPMGWFRRLKLEKAKELLRAERMTATEVALHCGFSGLFAFSKAFKREWGLYPSEAR